MSDLSHEAPDLDTRLADIDRRLREIQADLLPERDPRPSRPPEAVEPPPGVTPEPSLGVAAEAPEPPPAAQASEPPHAAEASEPPHAAEAPEPLHRGRSGPLATLLLQRSGPGDADRREGPPDRREPAPDAGAEPPPPPGPPQPPPERPPPAPPEYRPAPPPERPLPPSPPPPSQSMDQFAALRGMHVKLLSSMRDLLDAYEFVLTRTLAPDPAAEQAAAAELSLSAGPFAGTGAVRAFEQSLAGIPGVREVAVRGYEAGNRAIFDVLLAEQTA